MQTSLPITPINLLSLLRRFRWRIVLTVLLVIIEAVLNTLFPLFVGFAINGLLQESITELIYLGALGISLLIMGSLRRFYDTRAYSSIYTTISTEMVRHGQQQNQALTKIVVRANLLTEFVEFFEDAMPMIINSLIGIVGILIIIFTLDTAVFLACLALFVVVILIYVFSANINFRLNKNYNNELEKQVEVIASQKHEQIEKHFKSLMKWNIYLSDLETVNYASIWLAIIALLLYSPQAVIDSNVRDFGLIFSILTYVFQYIENLVMLPIFIQQAIRLHEISVRMAEQ